MVSQERINRRFLRNQNDRGIQLGGGFVQKIAQDHDGFCNQCGRALTVDDVGIPGHLCGRCYHILGVR